MRSFASRVPDVETQVNNPDDIKKEQLRYLFYEFWMLAETHKRLLARVGDTHSTITKAIASAMHKAPGLVPPAHVTSVRVG